MSKFYDESKLAPAWLPKQEIPSEPESIEESGRRWFKCSDGSSVHDQGPGTHVWARASPMSARCIYCRLIFQNSPDPLYEVCPEREPLIEAGECDHGISFNEEASKGLSSEEVRKKWPRLGGECAKGCGYNGNYYASFAHMIAGDW